MRKKWLLLSLVLLLFCASCTPAAQEETTPPEGEYGIWFLRKALAQEGGIRLGADSGYLSREFYAVPEGESVETALLEALITGPEGEELTSPFPAGTRLRSWSREENRVSVDLSEAYSGLAGVELSLADGCIVLTLCQLEGVEEVYITVEGRPRPFRDQVYTREDFMENNLFDPLPRYAQEELPIESGGPAPESAPSEE